VGILPRRQMTTLLGRTALGAADREPAPRHMERFAAAAPPGLRGSRRSRRRRVLRARRLAHLQSCFPGKEFTGARSWAAATAPAMAPPAQLPPREPDACSRLTCIPGKARCPSASSLRISGDSRACTEYTADVCVCTCDSADWLLATGDTEYDSFKWEPDAVLENILDQVALTRAQNSIADDGTPRSASTLTSDESSQDIDDGGYTYHKWQLDVIMDELLDEVALTRALASIAADGALWSELHESSTVPSMLYNGHVLAEENLVKDYEGDGHSQEVASQFFKLLDQPRMCCSARVMGWMSGSLDKVGDELDDVACRVIGTAAKGENLLLDEYYPVLELVLAAL